MARIPGLTAEEAEPLAQTFDIGSQILILRRWGLTDEELLGRFHVGLGIGAAGFSEGMAYAVSETVPSAS